MISMYSSLDSNLFPQSSLSSSKFSSSRKSHLTSLTARFTVLCNSSKSPSKSGSNLVESPPNPSLSEQLKPLSLTLLTETKKDANAQLQSKPKSVWVNPSRPKLSVLSLQRHKRSSYSYNPKLRGLKLLCKKLNESDFSETEFFEALKELDQTPTKENSLLILNSLKPWQKTHCFFNWLKNQNLFPIETIFYNVTMKSLRHGKQYELIEELANEMIQTGIELDNVTYSTIITCAKRCNLFDKAVEWFERMYKTGLMPDEVTYSAILDVYAKLGRVEDVLSLYERARSSGWQPDAVAFSVLGKMFGEAGDYDGIQYILQEMKSVGLEPNLIVYNTLLEAMGRAGKPGLARSLFEEMVSCGVSPNEKTLTALVKIYGKARWSRDALKLWERMRLNKWPMDFFLYNTLLSMCADLGLEEEAERLFDDMKQSEHCKPDSWSYTAMLNIYGSGGKVERALELFDELLASSIQLNVMSCTCLIQCLGRAKRIDDVVQVFDILTERGVKTDDRLCGCLLSVVTYCKEDELEKILTCLNKANPRLVEFVKMICEDCNSFDLIKQEFRGLLNRSEVEVRRPFCNCLIEFCRNKNLLERAHELLYLGTLYGLYPGLYIKTGDEWSLNLRSLSVGAAITAFEEWIRTLSEAMEHREVMPQHFSVYAGAGTHKFSQGLANSFAGHLDKLTAPFHPNEEKTGCFIASLEDLTSWMTSNKVSSNLIPA